MKLTCKEPNCGAVIQMGADSTHAQLDKLMQEHVKREHGKTKLPPQLAEFMEHANPGIVENPPAFFASLTGKGREELTIQVQTWKDQKEMEKKDAPNVAAHGSQAVSHDENVSAKDGSDISPKP
jgi:hypothetical protein